MAKPSHFPTKMTLAYVYALLNSIPGVILVLESEGFYYVVLENIHTQVEGNWNSKGNRVLSAKILNTKFQYETNWNFQKGERGGGVQTIILSVGGVSIFSEATHENSLSTHIINTSVCKGKFYVYFEQYLTGALSNP